MVFTEITGRFVADEFVEILLENSLSLSVYCKSRKKISQIFRKLSCVALPAVRYSLSCRKKIIIHAFFAVFPRTFDHACESAVFSATKSRVTRLLIVSDSTSKCYTRRTECETSLGHCCTRPRRYSFSVG